MTSRASVLSSSALVFGVREEIMKSQRALVLALMASASFVATAAAQEVPPVCSGLAAQLLKNSDITAATAAIVPAGGGNLSYCQVNITVSDLAGPENGYQPGQKQQINVRIGLPLSAADGGVSGSTTTGNPSFTTVQGNWNGRIQDLGGGGYVGSVGSVTGPTNAGYVGSSTDTGHSGGSGTFALNPDNTLNWGLIRDFAFNGIHAQAVWSKKLVQMYYGMSQKYTYWNGCSTGGRQGHQQAQKYPNDYDGILAGANAFNWDRFIPSEQYGEIVMNQEVGAPIAAAKLNAVTNAAIAACDRLDGINDGVVQDPRACTYSAQSFVCGTSNDPNCLTTAEARAVDKIWQGPPNQGQGQRRWFGLERGTPLTNGLDGATPFSISSTWLAYWVHQDPAFDWHRLTETTFNDDFYASEIKFHDVIGTDDPDLTPFQQHGGKMITYHGEADQLIFPRGTYNYYNRATDRAGGLSHVQTFYRFFPYPGNNHCGGNSTQPNAPLINTNDLMNALVNWVERGVAPDSILAYNGVTLATSAVSRPICKYPDKLVYLNSGSPSDASNFTCQPQTEDPLQNAEEALPDAGANHGNGQLTNLDQ